MRTISRIYYYNLNCQLKQSKTLFFYAFFFDFFIYLEDFLSWSLSDC